jgi:hypothetical protein
MAKSKARFLSELLGSTGLVKRSKSALAGADEVLDLDTIPTIPNSKLANATISIAGHSTALGGSVSLNTGNISEHTDYKYYTDARARAAVSVSGDLAYNSSTGVFSFTERTDAEVRGLVSATGSLSYNSTTGVMSFTMPAQNTSNVTEGSNLYFTNARADARIAAASTSDLSEGTNLYYTDARADARVALIVDSAPGTLNTLNELAAALGDDANFSTTITNSIAAKLPLTGGALTGNLIIDYTGHATNDAGLYVANDISDWGIYVNKDGTSTYGIKIAADGEYPFQITNSSGTEKFRVNDSGNVILAGTVDGRDVATDGTKLDGIEAGATADQTAAEILTAVKTVDGSGSGLDADLLDGIQGANLRKINSEYSGSVGTAGWYTIAEYGNGRAQGEFYIYDNDSSRHNFVKIDASWSFGNGGITCTANGKHGTLTIQHVRFLYNTSDQTYGGCKLQVYCANPTWTLRVRQMPSQMDGWGAFTQVTPVLANSVTSFALYSTATNVALNGGFSASALNWYAAGNLVWNAGNDSSGSGLDADLLDGVHAASFLRSDAEATSSKSLILAEDWGSDTHSSQFVIQGSHPSWETRGNSGQPYGWLHHQDSAGNYALYSIAGYTGNSWTQRYSFNKDGTFRNGNLAGNIYYHQGNDGSGSGLDADLLDGVDSTVYFKSPSNVSGWQDSNRNFSVRTGGNAVGLHMEESDGTFGFQLYGDSGSYGFLDGEWANWDIQKVVNGTFKVDEGSGLKRVLNEANWTSYITNNNQLTNGSGYQTSSGTVAQSHYVSGSAFATTGSTGSVLEYQQASSQTDTKLAPSSDWHNSIRMGHGNPYSYYSNTIAIRMTGSGLGDLYTQTISNNNAQGWNKHWHTNNDGAGSGLDADLLDGQHGSYYAPASSVGNGTLTVTTSGSASGGGTFTANQSGNTTINISATDTNTTYNFGGPTFTSRNSGNAIAIDSVVDNMVGYVNTSTAAGFADGAGFSAAYSSSWVGQLFVDFRTGKLSTRGKNNGTWQAHRFMWDNLNDGSGSGLDADLLDGANSDTGASANTIVKRDANGYIHGVYFNSAIGISEALSHDFTKIYMSNDNYIRTMGKSDFKIRMGLTKSDYDRMDYTSNTRYHTGANSHNEVTFNQLWGRGSGFIDNWNTGAGNPPSGSHFNGFQALHYTDGGSYHHGMQMVMSSGNPGLTFLKGHWANGGTGTSWQKIWTDGNDGSGSGLDADLFDGRDSSSYVFGASGYGSTNLGFASMTNQKSGFYDVHNSGTPTGTWYSLVNMAHYGSNHGHQIAGSFYSAGEIYNRNNNNTSLSAWAKIWNTANDGSGSGLDADTVDGIQGASFLRTDAGTTIANNITITQRGSFTTGTSGQNNSGIGGSYHYGYQTAGGWSHPFPDLVLGYHTGMRFGGYTAYGGCRFYDDHPNRTSTILFSVGNGDSNVRVTNNIYATQFLYNSDRAYKENIYPLENSLQKVLKLEGVNYTLKSNGTELIGFIAQDVEKIEPKVVDGKEGEKAVNYGQMVALLTEAMKEQQNMIVALQEEVKELKNATK